LPIREPIAWKGNGVPAIRSREGTEHGTEGRGDDAAAVGAAAPRVQYRSTRRRSGCGRPPSPIRRSAQPRAHGRPRPPRLQRTTCCMQRATCDMQRATCTRNARAQQVRRQRRVAITNGLSAADATLPVAYAVCCTAQPLTHRRVWRARRSPARSERRHRPHRSLCRANDRPYTLTPTPTQVGRSQRSAGLALSGNGPQWERV
jgi:hypothetical protein